LIDGSLGGVPFFLGVHDAIEDYMLIFSLYLPQTIHGSVVVFSQL
jgi:hypothetical protein